MSFQRFHCSVKSDSSMLLNLAMFKIEPKDISQDLCIEQVIFNDHVGPFKFHTLPNADGLVKTCIAKVSI
jgi:hypothetical protein